MSVPWQLWIDTGGTFTDCLARDPRGRLRRAKVLSSSALRGTVVEAEGPLRVRVREDWGRPRGWCAASRSGCWARAARCRWRTTTRRSAW